MIFTMLMSLVWSGPVAAAGEPPVAEDASAAARTGIPVEIFPTFFDPDDDPVEITSTTDPPNGSAICDAVKCTYTSDNAFVGEDSFDYTVSDGDLTDTGTISITVEPNNAPQASDESGTTKVNTPITVFPSFFDPDGDTVAITAHTDPTSGTATCDDDSCTYTPNTGFLGADSFDYTVSDGDLTDTATISITVVENSPPDAVDDAAATDEATPVDIFVLQNDSDADGDSLVVTANSDPANGAATCDEFGECTYTPDTGFVGTDTFQYTASDGEATDTATVTVTVSAVVVTPVTNDGSGAAALAGAITTNPAFVSGASFAAVPSTGTPNGVGDGALGGFPTNGTTFAVLTSGDARLADDPNTSGGSGAALGGASVRGNSDFDVTILKIDLVVPADRNCLTFDFRFLSDEFPEFVGSSFNDAFIAELDISDWTTSGSTITAPNNFAFDPNGDVISINSSGATSMTAAEASGTTYDGATPLLSASTPVTAGAHSLYLSIFDQGDGILDSAVFLDNLILGTTAAGACQTGATVLSAGKVADSATTQAGGSNGYTITISNGSSSAATLNSIFDVLPAGFTYVTGTTTGVTTSNPTVDGQTLTWSGPFSVPANGNVMLDFDVVVSTTPGDYFNNAGGSASGGSVSPTGPTAKITVTAVNAPPNAVDDSLTTPEDTGGTVNVLTNDTDPDGDTLTVSSFTAGAHGLVGCLISGECTYSPDANFHGTDSFTYTISDGHGGSDTATVNVTVTPVNDPPVAADDALTTGEDTPGMVTVLANDSDADGDTLTVTSSTNGTNGTVSCTPGGSCTYTPNAGFSGSDSFTYDISDGNGGTDGATVNVTVESEDNEAPDAVNDTLTTAEDTATSLNVLTNDTDPDGDTLAVTSSTNGANGTVSCTAAGMCTYTPAANFHGTDSFTYTISDGNGGTDTATVSVTVTPVNDAPSAANDTLTTAEDTATSLNVLTNDTDPDGDTLAVTSSTNGANGTVSCTAAGMCTYTPAANFHGTDSFTYTISDGNGGTDTATVSVTVTPVNDPPNAVDDTLTTAEDTAGSLNVLTNDTDVEGDTLTLVGSTHGAHGTVGCTTAGSCTYTPAGNYFGPDSFTYTISDGQGGTDTATVSVTVTSVNDPPNAVDDTLTTSQDTAGTVNVLTNDTDVDGDALTVTGSTNGANGTVSCTSAGDCIYTPNSGFSGTDSFTYTVSDGNGGTDTGSVSVTVTPATTEPMCNGLPATFVGDDGDDYFQGTPGVDVIVDSGGDNYIQTGGGDDHICVGDGDDEIDSGDGNDFVDAGEGNNKIKTGNGSDTVRSGNGNDDIDTGDGNDNVVDTGGRNKIFTGNGADNVTSGPGNDEIETGNGNDVVVDSGGNNSVNTGDGNDTITTGAGNDRIDGGNGFDTCNPGGGVNRVTKCEA